MPKLGEIIKGKGSHPQMYLACEVCGKERWVRIDHKRLSKYCKHCAGAMNLPPHKRGSDSHCWKGGRGISGGYIFVRIQPDDFFYTMQSNLGYIREHRLVMAKHLGRCLHSWEIVHHKNGDRADNRIENLELTTSGAHSIAHHKGYKDGYKKGLADAKIKIQELESKIRELGGEL